MNSKKLILSQRKFDQKRRSDDVVFMKTNVFSLRFPLNVDDDRYSGSLRNL